MCYWPPPRTCADIQVGPNIFSENPWHERFECRARKSGQHKQPLFILDSGVIKRHFKKGWSVQYFCVTQNETLHSIDTLTNRNTKLYCSRVFFFVSLKEKCVEKLSYLHHKWIYASRIGTKSVLLCFVHNLAVQHASEIFTLSDCKDWWGVEKFNGVHHPQRWCNSW